MGVGYHSPSIASGTASLVARAVALYEQRHGDPDKVAAEATALIDEARAADDHEAQVVAMRVLAEACRYLVQHERAVALLEEAARVARQHGLTARMGEVLTSRGVVRLELGRTDDARRDLDRAARLLGPAHSIEIDLQRAALAHNAGRLADAAAMYAGVLARPELTPSARQKASNNLGALEATLGNHDSADRWLELAAKAARDIGPASVAVVAETHAWAMVQAGRLTEGVARFDEAVSLWQQAELPLGELYSEYADALADLRLLPEARDQAEQAADMLMAQGVPLMAVEAQMRVARLALAMGDAVAAERLAEDTASHLRRQRRSEWKARASLVATEARLLQGRPRREDHAAAIRAGQALRRSAGRQAVADAFLTAGRVAHATDRRAMAAKDWDRAAELAPRVPVLARVKGQVARALAAQVRRSDTDLLRACKVGLNDLATHRAALPSTELRALASGHGAELSALGLGAVVRANSAARVLAWMERTRAAALSAVEPGRSEGLDDELGALHAVHTEITRARRVDRTELPALLSRQSEIEARIRHSAWTDDATESSAPAARQRFSTRALRMALDGRTLVEYDVLDGRIIAAVVEDRRTRLVDVGHAASIEAEIDELRSALQALTVCIPQMAGHLRDTAVDLVERLRRLLVEPLRTRGLDGVVVVPVGELQRVPWSAMFDSPVSVAPSATLWMETSQRKDPETRVVLAAGPALDRAVDEVGALAAAYDDPLVLVPPQSRVDPVKQALDGASLAHLSCHGEVRADNPTFSSLLLSDGSLTVHELDRRAGAPHRMILAACDVGGSVAYPGNEVLGFIGTLLTRGAAGVVASTTLVLDHHVTPLMMVLHERVRSGETLADALHAARAAVDVDDPRAYPAWATFTAYGSA